MAAGMHDVDLAAVGELLLRGRCMGQTGGFLHRVRIHVGAEPQRRAGAVFQHADNAGLADAGGDIITQRLQFLRDDAAGADFGEGDFGMLVQVLEDRHQPRRVGIDRRRNAGDVLGRRRGDGRCGQRGRGQHDAHGQGGLANHVMSPVHYGPIVGSPARNASALMSQRGFRLGAMRAASDAVVSADGTPESTSPVAARWMALRMRG